MHSAKVIGKVKNDEERERQVTDLKKNRKQKRWALREIGLKELLKNKEQI